MNLVFRLKIRYLINKLNKYAAKKYRVVEIDENIFRLQVYDDLSFTSYEYKYSTYVTNKYKDNWLWHDLLTETTDTYDELVCECNKLRLSYKIELIDYWRKIKNKKKYPRIVY